MSRRGENIYKRKDGRWEGRYIKGQDIIGRAKYGYVYAKTYMEVKEKLNEIKTQPLNININPENTKTVEQMCFIWLDEIKSQLKSSSYVKYYNIVNNHIIPSLGKYKIQFLDTATIRRFTDEKLAHGRIDGTGGLSPKTVKDYLSVIKLIIDYASNIGVCCNVNFDLINIKSCDNNIEVLSASQRKTLSNYLINNINNTNLGILICLYTGLRIGEICALKFGDISATDKVVHIRKTKTYKVNCILVKDFSRFGRNSIEVGYFTQQIFPLFGVRFISVSDNYDSDEHKGDTGGIAVAVKYLVNEYYSRDLSVKTKSAKYTKMRRGEYKSGNYTYGYKSGKNGEQIIDEKAAETVKMIFELTADGKSAAYISKLLFDKNIPTPAQYKGIKGNYGSRFPNCKYWSISTINRIIVNEQYMGMFVMLKQKVQDVGSTKVIKRDESEWIKIPNHHENIVSKELFERANAVRRTFKQPNKQQRSYPLRGKVECGCCQHAMDYVPKKTPIYRCSYTRNDETEPCYKSEIPESSLNKAIFDIISKQAEIILNIDDVSKADTAQIKTEQLADIEKQIVACQKEKQKLYEHLLTEKITLDEYRQLKQEYDTKAENYQTQYDKYRRSEEQLRLKNENRAKTLQTAKAIKKEHTLTQALADMLIEKVCVYPDNRLEIEWKIKDFCAENTVKIC